MACYNNDSNITLTITESQWNAIIACDGFGEVHLRIVGSTDASKVTVRTFGDGVVSDYTLNLDSNNNFNEDVIISFTHAPDSNVSFKSNTVITAYKNNKTKEVELSSSDLNYSAVDCLN